MIPTALGALDALDTAKRAHLRDAYTAPAVPVLRPALGRLLVRVGDRLAATRPRPDLREITAA